MSSMPVPAGVQQASLLQVKHVDDLRSQPGVAGLGSAVRVEMLPFVNGDVMAGSEHELQGVVMGQGDRVDMPLTIEASNFHTNIERRIDTGEAPKRVFVNLRSIISAREGMNFTHYGLFIANAHVLAVGLCYVLWRSLGISGEWAVMAMALLLSACVPASRMVAPLVEKKAHAFTVAGASFVGVILAPWIILLTNTIMVRWHHGSAYPVAVMAALTIALALGEGMGRLACLSFGCCHGRPLAACSPLLRRVLLGSTVVFSGATKKTAYDGGLAGQPLIPIQTLTAIIHTTAALSGLWLFFRGYYSLACLGVLAVTQGWRFCSGFIRADYRGKGTISTYQGMGMATVIYTSFFFPASTVIDTTPRPDIAAGLTALWAPAPILSLQLLWLLIFVYMSRSTVIRSIISFHVRRDRI